MTTRKLSLGHRYVRGILAAILLGGGPSSAFALQDDKLNFFLAGAYPLALGVTYQYMNGEFGISGGFGFKRSNWPVGLQLKG